MHLSMSSESLHEILGTYSAIEALKKLARLDRPEDDLDSSCVCFSNIRIVSDAFCSVVKNQLLKTDLKGHGVSFVGSF